MSSLIGKQVFRILFIIYRGGVGPLIHLLWGPGGGCRFEPTCSQYAEQSVQEYGLIRGGILAVRRILRCHPWGGRGWDPVPSGENTALLQPLKKGQC